MLWTLSGRRKNERFLHEKVNLFYMLALIFGIPYAMDVIWLPKE